MKRRYILFPVLGISVMVVLLWWINSTRAVFNAEFKQVSRFSRPVKLLVFTYGNSHVSYRIFDMAVPSQQPQKYHLADSKNNRLSSVAFPAGKGSFIVGNDNIIYEVRLSDGEIIREIPFTDFEVDIESARVENLSLLDNDILSLLVSYKGDKYWEYLTVEWDIKTSPASAIINHDIQWAGDRPREYFGHMPEISEEQQQEANYQSAFLPWAEFGFKTELRSHEDFTDFEPRYGWILSPKSYRSTSSDTTIPNTRIYPKENYNTDEYENMFFAVWSREGNVLYAAPDADLWRLNPNTKNKRRLFSAQSSYFFRGRKPIFPIVMNKDRSLLAYFYQVSNVGFNTFGVYRLLVVDLDKKEYRIIDIHDVEKMAWIE